MFSVFSNSKVKRRHEIEGLVIPENIAKESAWLRLQDQLYWYDDESVKCHWWYISLKVLQIFLAISIPLAAILPDLVAKWIASTCGATIALLEGIQHLNQYSALWISYRSTAERLKHEKYLFLSVAGPYIGMVLESRLIILSERTEEHVSTEHANWIRETIHTKDSIKAKMPSN